MYLLISIFSSGTMGVFACFQPILTIVLAFYFLKERMPTQGIFTVLAATAGASLLVSGGSQAALLQTELPLAAWLTGILLLMVSPLLLAAGTVSLRSLGEIHFAVVPTYVNLTLTVLSAGVLVTQGGTLSFLGSISSHVWVLLIIMSTLLIGIQVTMQ
jgi:drug/metabolite transporter (DMT)-like permease